MTRKQKLFNRVVKFLRNQGGPSLSEGGGRCLYRGRNNRKCAAGAIIPDKYYSHQMEGMTIFGVLHHYKNFKNFFMRSYGPGCYTLIGNLQDAHDVHLHIGMKSFEMKVKEIADLHKLTVPPL